VNEWIPLVVALVPAFAAVMAYRAATKANRITAESADRGKLTDDLQEEVAALRSVVGETRQEADQLRVRLRVAMEYLDLCWTTMRRNGVEPPPVPTLVRYPWEGD
jgi:hypothetical protein